MRTFACCLAAVWCLAGCAESKVSRFAAADFSVKAPLRIAVLPFDNQSVDLVGPELLRKLVVSDLRERGYDPVPIEKVDEGLQTIGITDGGQLRAVTPQQVGKTLGVEGLFYGDVEEFAFLNVGFALRRVVRLNLKFLLAPTGDALWEDTGQGLTEYFTLNKKEAWRAFVESLVVREAENIFHTPLMSEAQQAVQNLFVSLPAHAALGVGVRVGGAGVRDGGKE